MAQRIRTCYDCGAQVEADALICSACHGSQLTYGHARPRQPTVLASPPLPWPWSTAIERLPAGGLVGLFGPKGSGKSSLAAVLRPDLWLTSEQIVSQANGTISYALGEAWQPTEIKEVKQPAEIGVVLGRIHAGMVVLDSVTRCGGLREQLQVLELLEAWCCAGPDRRACAILQVNDKGEPAGLTENEHLVTTVCGVAQEESGLRRVFTEKNRYGPLGVAYFRFGRGGLEQPKLQYSYSVEGSTGRYQLMPYPSKGARWDGLLRAAFESQVEGEVNVIARPGLASAGRHVPGYPNNALYPADVGERRRFAEAHGLTWFGGPDG